MRILVTVLLILTLAGCNSNNDNESDIRITPGLYDGNFIVTGGGSNLITALVTESNEVRLMIAGQAVGELTQNGDSFTGNFVLYQNGSIYQIESANIVLNVSVTDTSINGTWSNANSSGQIFLTKTSDENQIVDPAQLAGNWVLNLASSGGSLYTLTLTIDAMGNITGSDTSVCNYMGNILEVSQIGRVMPFELTISSCGAMDGVYNGLLAASTITFGHSSTLLANNDDYAFTVTLVR